MSQVSYCSVQTASKKPNERSQIWFETVAGGKTLGHTFDFDNAQVVDTVSHFHKRLIKERIHMTKNATVNKRTDTQNLSHLYSVILNWNSRFVLLRMSLKAISVSTFDHVPHKGLNSISSTSSCNVHHKVCQGEDFSHWSKFLSTNSW